MHESYFHLQRDAFAVSPDPRFLYAAPAHAEALAGLLYGVQARKGVMALTGEVGTGKTLLLRCLMRSLPPQQVACCYVFHGRLGGSDLLRYLLADLGLEAGPKPKSDLLLQLSAHLVKLYRSGMTAVLILDEAQALGANTLEEVRLLTNLESADAKLLQVVLAGQPELAALIDSHRMRQLRQRIVLRFDLPALSAEQTQAYITSRLQQAGHPNGDLFRPEAVRRLHELSGGIPRIINVLCGNALLNAYALQQPEITAALIDEAGQDLGLGAPPRPRRERFAPVPVGQESAL